MKAGFYTLKIEKIYRCRRSKVENNALFDGYKTILLRKYALELSESITNNKYSSTLGAISEYESKSFNNCKRIS